LAIGIITKTGKELLKKAFKAIMIENNIKGELIMGWCNGSHIAEDIFNKIEKYLPEEVKKEVAQMMYDRFCDDDADCWDNEMNIMKYVVDSFSVFNIYCMSCDSCDEIN